MKSERRSGIMKQNDEKGRAADDAGYHKDHEGAGTDAGAVSDRQRGEQLPPYPGQRRLPGAATG